MIKLSLLMNLQMGQWIFDENNKKNENAGIVETGLSNLLTIGDKEEIVVSSMPANE